MFRKLPRNSCPRIIDPGSPRLEAAVPTMHPGSSRLKVAMSTSKLAFGARFGFIDRDRFQYLPSGLVISCR
jgi:hypothetical protein